MKFFLLLNLFFILFNATSSFSFKTAHKNYSYNKEIAVYEDYSDDEEIIDFDWIDEDDEMSEGYSED